MACGRVSWIVNVGRGEGGERKNMFVVPRGFRRCVQWRAGETRNGIQLNHVVVLDFNDGVDDLML